MPTYKAYPHIGLLAAALLAALPAAAQKSAPPADAAPKLEKLEEGEPPSIKIGKPEIKKKVTERGEGGEIKEEQVTSGRSTYYVKPNQQVGTSVPGDAQSSQNHGVQWKVKEFDLGFKKKNNQDGTPPTNDEPAPAQK
jgi:hypothetical protein